MPQKPGKFKWVTNGEDEFRMLINDPTPSGYHRGRSNVVKTKIQITVQEFSDSMTEQEKNEHSRKVKEGFAKMSDDRKLELIEIRKRTFQRNIELLSEEERKERFKGASNHIKKIQSNRTEEQRRESARKCSETKLNYPDEKKKELALKQSNRWASLTEEQKKERMQPLMEASRKWFSDEANQIKVVKKINETKRKNGTFKSSKKEDKYYEMLVEKYLIGDVFRNYDLDKRYPFHCDFYIKSLDLFIELNLHWTHGLHPFDEKNLQDIVKLQKWEEKANKSKYYKNAIEVWTVRDVIKRKTAERNNLNYETIYEY